MKKWQLIAVVADEQALLEAIDQSFSDQDVLPAIIVHSILCQSNKVISYFNDNYLRLDPINPAHYHLGISVREQMPVVEAYVRLGANAITEVIDYGSFPLSGIRGV